jgi:HD-like signal output (HDOD) protein
MDLADLVAARQNLPSAPRVVALLLGELARSEPDLRRIDLMLSADPALASRVLQAANAPHFQLAGQVASVSEALAVLRLGQVQAMVSSAAAQASAQAAPGLSMVQFVTYSVDCAKVARSLAGLVRLGPQAAYSAALVHGVGLLAMRAYLPQALALDAKVGPLDLKRIRAERALLGFACTQVSAGLARQWHLPGALVDALAHAHAPFENEAYEPLAGVVHLAMWRSRARQMALTGNALTVTFPLEVADVLGLDMDMVMQQDPIDWSAQVPGRMMTAVQQSE